MRTQSPLLIRPGFQPMPFPVHQLARRPENRLGACIRIPVTPENRVLLRELRAAELADWNRAFRNAHSQARNEVRQEDL